MTAFLEERLTQFAEWLAAEDTHAKHHLRLLEEADAALLGLRSFSPEERMELAARLERWRYQHLKERGESVRNIDWRLADALDLAANELAGRPTRAPRQTNRYIQRHGTTEPVGEPWWEALNRDVPLESVCEQAAHVTAENFSPGRNAVCASGASPGLAPGKGENASAQAPKNDRPEFTHPDQGVVRRWRIFMYTPLYLSSYCVNYCTYCGFRYNEPIERKHLTVAEAVREAEVLLSRGFRHILLVAGDFPQLTSPQYFLEVVEALVKLGVDPGIEIAPQPTEVYEELARAGVRSITLYQETYIPEVYRQYHPRGPKAAYHWRLEGLDRAGEAGIGRLGLGLLLGLGDPRTEFPRLVRHGQYLKERFPKKRLAFSLPRIHEAPADFKIPYPVDDETFIRLYCGLRLAFPDAELVLSTRESPELRNRLAKICITQMSAGSSTVPGGYADLTVLGQLGKQFPVHDDRSPAEVCRWLEENGFELVWRID